MASNSLKDFSYFIDGTLRNWGGVIMSPVIKSDIVVRLRDMRSELDVINRNIDTLLLGYDETEPLVDHFFCQIFFLLQQADKNLETAVQLLNHV
jgi:hypothetical protein